MECVDAKLRMEPYATGNLSSPDREAFEEHVAHCEGCRLELELTRAMSGSGEIEDPARDSGGDVPAGDVPAAEELAIEGLDAGDAPAADGPAADGPAADFPAAPATDPEISFADIAPGAQSDTPPDLSLDALLSSVQPPEAAPAASQDATRAFEPNAAPPSIAGAPAPAAAASVSPAGARMPPATTAPRSRASVDDPLANLVASAPTAPAPSQVPPGGAPSAGSSSAGASTASGPAWNFEPADAKPQAPPPGSLFMAEEVLQRGKGSDADRRHAILRLSLWVAGGVAGLALLAFAGWIALNARPAPPRTADLEAAPPAAGGAVETPAAPAPAPIIATTPSEPTGSAASGVEAAAPQSAAPQSAAPQGAPEVATPPAAAPVVEAGAASVQSPLPSGEGAAPASRGQAAGTPERKVSSRARAQTGATASGSRSTEARASRSRGDRVNASRAASPAATGSTRREPFTPAPSPARESGSSTAGSQETASPAPGAQSAAPGAQSAAPGTQTAPATPPASGDASRAPAAPQETAPGGAGSPAVAPPSGGASSTPPAAPAQPAPAPGGTTKQAAPETPSAGAGAPGAAPGAPAADAVQRPIDRIHLATVAAEDRGDLSALRKLRDTWRGFIDKTGVGADRIRAKRELADCLWAIQSLTARRSDQRDALRAYRDYILNAPAGGADARSISRTRQLEDALSESR